MARDTDRNASDASLMRFASMMKRIPRKPLRCEVYGTVSAIVDRKHATAIFRKVAPAASLTAVYDALLILDDRVDAAQA